MANKDNFVTKILHLDSVISHKFSIGNVYLWPYCRQLLYKTLRSNENTIKNRKKYLFKNLVYILFSQLRLHRVDNLYLISNRHQIFDLVDDFNEDQDVKGSRLYMFQLGHDAPKMKQAAFTDIPKIIVRIIAKILNPKSLSQKMRLVFFEALLQFYYFKLIYLIVRPKVVYFINWYDFYPALAALPKSTKSIEIQHGVIHDFHLGYNFGNIKPELIRVPDILALWDMKTVNKVRLAHKPTVIEYKRRSLLSNQNVNEGKKKLIIISQHSIRSQIELRLPDLLETYNDYAEYIYRLHPKDNHRCEEIKNLLSYLPQLRVETSDMNDFNRYLSATNIFCGVYSTLFLDLISAGYNCIVINMPEVNRIHNLLDSENVRLF